MGCKGGKRTGVRLVVLSFGGSKILTGFLTFSTSTFVAGAQLAIRYCMMS